MGGPKNPESDASDPNDEFGDFDYGAVEEELVDDPLTEPSTSLPATEAPVRETRRTFDRSLTPKDDATFSTHSLGPYQVVSIRGRLNESFPYEDILSQLDGPVVLDLRDVDRVSSFGVRGWLTLLRDIPSPEIHLSHCSDAIVNQITVMRNFCGNATIHSFLAPYVCASCSAAFNVYYHGIDDRKHIEARRPAEVPCPECGEATEMDEDPFTYFDLVDHLATEAKVELEHAIASLDDLLRPPPVEIERDGNRTAVRFRAAVTRSTPFETLFSGIEGEMTLDLGSAPSIDHNAAEALLEALSKLDASIIGVHLEGSPDEVTRRVLHHQLDRVQLRSLLTPVVDQVGGKTGPALIDLELHGPELAAGRPLALPLSWAQGHVKPTDEAFIAQILAHETQLDAAEPPAAVAAPAHEANPALPVWLGIGVVVLLLLGAVAFFAT